MQDDLASLRRQIRALKLYMLVLTCAALVALTSAFRGNSDAQVLRARGLIIVDAAGHERILIGAPIPAARNRVRTDTARVRKIWGSRFPSQYMAWYQQYRHTMNGMLILDAAGFDRVAIGDSVPDPNVGRRVAPGTGLVINDERGDERSAYQLLKVSGQKRMVLGLDNARGEALDLFVDDSGHSGVMVNDEENRAYLGTAPANDPILNDSASFVGLMMKKGSLENRVTPGMRDK